MSYLNHKMPAKMGMDCFDWQEFEEQLAKANKQQVEQMLIEIQREIKKRIEAKNW